MSKKTLLSVNEQTLLLSLESQIFLRSKALEALRHYKDGLDGLPKEIQSIEDVFANLLFKIEQNINVLNATCDTVRLLADIDEHLALTSITDIATDIQKSWSELENIVTVFSTSTEQEILRTREKLKSAGLLNHSASNLPKPK